MLQSLSDKTIDQTMTGKAVLKFETPSNLASGGFLLWSLHTACVGHTCCTDRDHDDHEVVINGWHGAPTPKRLELPLPSTANKVKLPI